MPPKARAPKKVKKSLLAKRPASQAPAAIKGLAGFRKASAQFDGAVDKGVAQQDAGLASRASVLPGLDARLVRVEPSRNSDQYYMLQGLEDPRVPAGKSARCYAFQRWGRTGTGGVCRLQGPMAQTAVEKHLFRVFKAKTGIEWRAPAAARAKPGKYWRVTPADSDPGARWQFLSEGGFGGSSKGSWHSYEAEAAKQMEELFAEHKANKGGLNPVAKRFVTTGSFTYQVDFDALTQRNTVTSTSRKIRRVITSCAPEAAAPPERAPLRPPPTETLPIRRSGSSSRLSSKADALKAPSSHAEMVSLVRSGEVEQLPVPALREWLRKNNISATGSKLELVERVRCLVW